MISNLGSVDRVLRFFLGFALLAAPLLNVPAIWSDAPIAYVSMTMGVVLIITALISFCPLYRIFGLSTCQG